MTRSLLLLTGEYPPAAGGVSDYCAQIARALAARARRADVHVFAPAPARHDPPVIVHTLPDHFGVASLAMLEDSIRRLPRPIHIILQYVPHAFGWRAMNAPLCAWLLWRSRVDRITVVFHEVTYPIRWDQPVHHNLLGAMNHGMAMTLSRAARRGGMLVTIPAWEKLLRKLGARGPIEICPVPSNLPTTVPRSAIERLRADHLSTGRMLVGAFGSFGPLVATIISSVLPLLIRDDRRFLLIGKGSQRFASPRVSATGPVEPCNAAAAIAACDVMLQPYPDGISGRRSSAIAALALGTPVVTNSGPLTEDFWQSSGAVALAGSSAAGELADTFERVVTDAAERARLGRAGMELYDQRLALRHTVARLLTLVGHQ